MAALAPGLQSSSRRGLSIATSCPRASSGAHRSRARHRASALRNIRNHELIDDKVIPDTFDFGWSVTIDELGVRIPQRAVKDAQGYETGHELQHPIKDLRDFELLEACGPPASTVSARLRDRLSSRIFWVICCLSVCEPGVFGCTMLTHRVVELMGMQAYFIAMLDMPDEVHRLDGLSRATTLCA